jgi:CRISPR-associated protein Cmr1
MRGIEERNIALRFLTPAFLGDASGASELRSPPFKALLRQWWRVAWTNGGKPDPEAMREEEGRLFGHAWLQHPDEKGRPKTWAMKSQVQVCVPNWHSGDMKRWENDPAVHHPEVGDSGRNVGAHLYLGYGPLGYSKENRVTNLNRPSAFGAESTVTVRICFPEKTADKLQLEDVLNLWRALGCIGSRSRNGWGSIEVVDSVMPESGSGLHWNRLSHFSRRFEDCLGEEWSHAIGLDDSGPMLWHSRHSFASWSDAMKELARVKIAFRTELDFMSNRDVLKPVVDDRHLLAYPVTNHGVLEWSERDRNGSPKLAKGKLRQTSRLANQLFCKVVRNGVSSFHARIVHLPHCLPRDLFEALPPESKEFVRERQAATWMKAHGVLDKQMLRWSPT